MNRRTKRNAVETASGPVRTKKVAIYIRVSTNHQIDKDSLPMQRKDLIAYSSLMLGIENYVIFEDAGYSGKNTDRPAFAIKSFHTFSSGRLTAYRVIFSTSPVCTRN